MEEKERFEFDNCNFMIRDTIENNIYEDSDLDDIAILLNKQEETIKNLQKLNGETIILNRTVTKDSQILEKENEQLKQSQKQLAISELEKLKKEFDSRKLEYKTMENSFHIHGLRIERIFEIIDDQIKELGDGE